MVYRQSGWRGGDSFIVFLITAALIIFMVVVVAAVVFVSASVFPFVDIDIFSKFVARVTTLPCLSSRSGFFLL